MQICKLWLKQSLSEVKDHNIDYFDHYADDPHHQKNLMGKGGQELLHRDDMAKRQS